MHVIPLTYIDSKETLWPCFISVSFTFTILNVVLSMCGFSFKDSCGHKMTHWPALGRSNTIYPQFSIMLHFAFKIDQNMQKN